MATQSVDNKTFTNPTVGTELTVYFRNPTSEVDTATTKYMSLRICKKVQIRSNKFFKVTKIDGTTLTSPSSSSASSPTYKLDFTNTSNWISSIVFEAEEANGEYQVLAMSGVDTEG